MGRPVAREPALSPLKHDKDTGLSEPLHEFETRIKEREFVDVGI